jgi:hypothetical protein
MLPGDIKHEAATSGHDFNQPLDIVYLFRHSKHDDLEIRYSLRSVAQNLPFIRKVWIFDSKPAFISNDKSIIEHIPLEYIAPLLNLQNLRDDFTLLFLASLIPGVAFDFLRFADDYILLQPLTRGHFFEPRALQDLSQATSRGSGKWKEQLWRTYDLLKEYGYTGYNFEVHLPQPMTKKLVFETYMSFRSFTRTERYGGILSETAMFNYGIHHAGLSFKWLRDEDSRAGFFGKCPTSEELAEGCQNKLFLSYDDDAFGNPVQAFLESLFPAPCKYEHR